MPRLAWSKRKGAPNRRPRPNQALMLEPRVAERKLQARIDTRIVIPNRCVGKMNRAHIKCHGMLGPCENLHPHTDARREVDVRGISRRNLVCGVDESTLG